METVLLRGPEINIPNSVKKYLRQEFKNGKNAAARLKFVHFCSECVRICLFHEYVAPGVNVGNQDLGDLI